MMTDDEINEVFKTLGISKNSEREKILTQGRTYCKVEEEQIVDTTTDSITG